MAGRVEAPVEIRVLTIAVVGLYFIPPIGSTLPKMRQTFKKHTANIIREQRQMQTFNSR